MCFSRASLKFRVRHTERLQRQLLQPPYWRGPLTVASLWFFFATLQVHLNQSSPPWPYASIDSIDGSRFITGHMPQQAFTPKAHTPLCPWPARWMRLAGPFVPARAKNGTESKPNLRDGPVEVASLSSVRLSCIKWLMHPATHDASSGSASEGTRPPPPPPPPSPPPLYIHIYIYI